MMTWCSAATCTAQQEHGSTLHAWDLWKFPMVTGIAANCVELHRITLGAPATERKTQTYYVATAEVNAWEQKVTMKTAF